MIVGGLTVAHGELFQQTRICEFLWIPVNSGEFLQFRWIPVLNWIPVFLYSISVKTSSVCTSTESQILPKFDLQEFSFGTIPVPTIQVNSVANCKIATRNMTMAMEEKKRP